MLDLGAAHGTLSINLAEAAGILAPTALPVGHENRRRVIDEARVIAQREAILNSARHDAAALGVAVLPNFGAHHAVSARRAFEDGGVVADERQDRRERARDAVLAHAIAGARVVDAHLRRRASPHHTGPEGAHGAEVAIHILVALLGDKLQARRARRGMIARLRELPVLRRKHAAKLLLESLEACLRAGQFMERACGKFHLSSRFDGHRLAGARHAQKVALGVVGCLRVIGAQRFEHALDAVFARVVHRRAVLANDDMLELDAERAFAGYAPAFDERRDCVDVAIVHLNAARGGILRVCCLVTGLFVHCLAPWPIKVVQTPAGLYKIISPHIVARCGDRIGHVSKTRTNRELGHSE